MKLIFIISYFIFTSCQNGEQMEHTGNLALCSFDHQTSDDRVAHLSLSHINLDYPNDTIYLTHHTYQSDISEAEFNLSERDDNHLTYTSGSSKLVLNTESLKLNVDHAKLKGVTKECRLKEKQAGEVENQLFEEQR